MNRTSLFVFFAAVGFPQQPIPRTIFTGYQAGNTVAIRLKSILYLNSDTPAPKQLAGAPRHGMWSVKNDGTGATHAILDDRSKSYFGYDLAIAKGAVDGELRLTFSPPTPRLVDHLSNPKGVPAGATYKQIQIPSYPPPVVAHDGDTVAVDLMVSPDGMQRLTDYIQIFSHEPVPKPATTRVPPVDFTIDDGQPVFEPFPVFLWVDGEPSSKGRGGLTLKPGATFWIAFPGQGRYLLSLAPHPGFEKAGAIRDNVIQFRTDHNYEVRFLSPIAGAGKAWNLYLLHDPTYESKDLKQVHMGVDRLENLLPKP